MNPEGLLDALAVLPGGPELLQLGQEREDLAVVGGAVRDLLLGAAPRELDVVVADDAAAFAGALAVSLAAAAGDSIAQPSATLHERFGTAIVEWQSGRVDVAQRRTESYGAPGALPDVRPGTSDEDLRRRDFTVNAIAVPLGGPRLGELISVEHALEDLEAGRLRVLHERSFIDDPTRLLRLARYSARLRFAASERTAELAAEALAAGALASVSGARIGTELRLALAEQDAVGALASLSSLGVLDALHGSLDFDERLARNALALLPEDGRPDLLLMASLLLAPAGDRERDRGSASFELLADLQFAAAERERIIRSAQVAPSLASELALPLRPSELHEALSSHPLEAVALGGALAEPRASGGADDAARWLQRLRHVRLAITGDDLIAAGVPAGPQIGERLALALARKLDGELDDGRLPELRAALEPSG